ncbi:MAG: tRNA lysidine(34) synthetase TilS [Clostridia bacterium]|nr:tRNA lysidine(34) synthetase TilS [Clostridia bacterium]
MIDKVIKTAEKYNMFDSGGRVIVALSGGSDSMALLHSLILLKDRFNITVEAAHVNHCIRGESADRDEMFVRKVCGELGIKLHCMKADIPSMAKDKGMTLEQAGRIVRYDFFNSVCCGGIIATAHNLNDRIETFLFNFTRGSTLRGLCSIPPVRDNIVRPIIDCSKREILDFCDKNNIIYVTDETNSDTVYARNRIRHKVIPELLEINPSFESAALRCICSLNEDETYLFNSAMQVYENSKTDQGYSIDTLCDAPEIIKKRAVAYILDRETGADIDMTAVKIICEALGVYKKSGRGMKIQIPGGLFARTRAGILEFSFPDKSGNSDIVILEPGNNIFGSYLIELNYNDKLNNYSQIVSNELSVFNGDSAIINGRLYARARVSDDKIRFKSRGISKSLRKIQNEKQMPPEIRDSIPVICDDKGLLCAHGCGIDERFEITDKTENIALIRITEL